MIMQLVWLALGLALVIKGGELFVESSVDIAHRMRIPRIVVGGTLVSLATTTPELVVSATASFMGDAGIAIGNAVGSAICNIGLIVGISALITVIRIDLREFKVRAAWMVGSAILVILFSLSLYMSRAFGSALVLLAVLYLFFDYWNMRRKKKQKEETVEEVLVFEGTMTRSILIFSLGAFMVIVGSRLLVTSGIAIAQMLKIPSVIIGLSVIAVGTSLPELVTAIVSARKGVSDLSIGNIVGANVLNLGLITGISALINPLTLTRFTQVYSFPWMLIFIFGMIFLFRKDGILTKKGGLMLLALYIIYLAGLIVYPML